MLKKTHTKTTKYHKTTTKNTFRNVIKEGINERHKMATETQKETEGNNRETQNNHRDTKCSQQLMK